MLTKNDLKDISELLDKKIEPLKKDVKFIKKTVSVLVNRTDREETQLGKRITRLEEHAGLPSPQ